MSVRGVQSMNAAPATLRSPCDGPRVVCGGDQYMMTFRPLYDHIVVKRIEEQETTRNGIVIPDSAKEKPQEGEVMAVGKGKRLDDGKVVALEVHVGDRVLFGKYTGNDIKLDGIEYIIMREDDVLGVL